MPFARVAEEHRSLLGELLPRIAAVMESGDLIGGRELAAFEHRFAEYHEADHAVGVNSGTDALRLTFRALGFSRGSVGITVANTFIATAAAMIAEGIRPLFVDVGADENIDPDAVRAAITADTRLVVAVHLRGWPARADLLREICAERGAALIEDCAQAVGATLGGRAVGTFGIAGCFSLHPLKNLAASGDGGVIVTNDSSLARELRLLRNHGLADRDTVVRWGENSRLDAIQAAVLNVKLAQFPAWTQRRQQLARIYDRGLSGLPLVLPPTGCGDRVHVFHRYCIRTARRDGLRAFLDSAGIGTAIHYPVPIHQQPVVRDGDIGVPASGLPVTEQQAGEIVSLPLHPSHSDDQIRAVVREIQQFFVRDQLADGR